MTINELIIYLKKYRLVFCLGLVVGAGTGALLAKILPVRFEASQTIFVKRLASVGETQFYTYDGYYSAQAAERFADSVFGALKNKETLRFLLSQAFQNETTLELNRELTRLKVKRISPQLLSLTYRGLSPVETPSKTQAISQALLKLSQSLTAAGDRGLSVDLVGPPIVVAQTFSLLILSLVGGLLAFLLILILTSLREFWLKVGS